MSYRTDAKWAARRRQKELMRDWRYRASVERERTIESSVDTRVVISGQEGRGTVERLKVAPPSYPNARVRVLVRWEGSMQPGAVLELPITGERLNVLAHKPLGGRGRRHAVILCSILAPEPLSRRAQVPPKSSAPRSSGGSAKAASCKARPAKKAARTRSSRRVRAAAGRRRK